MTDHRRAAAELARARDQAVEAAQHESAFLANVSHEIRTPMNGVLGLTDALLEMGLTDEQRDCSRRKNIAVRRADARDRGDILDISKIETGRLELDLADFDLGAAIGETCAGAAALAELKGLRLAVHIADEVPRRVHGDGRRLQQVLADLSNAVKFTPAGTVTVAVRAWPAGANASRVLFEVSDTGIGIAPGDVDRMFEPFTQADASMARVYGGTGLGLAIARELVELMGGRIGAEAYRRRAAPSASRSSCAPRAQAADLAASALAAPR